MVVVAATCVETLASVGKHILDCCWMNTLQQLCLQVQWIVESSTFKKSATFPERPATHIPSACSYRKFQFLGSALALGHEQNVLGYPWMISAPGVLANLWWKWPPCMACPDVKLLILDQCKLHHLCLGLKCTLWGCKVTALAFADEFLD